MKRLLIRIAVILVSIEVLYLVAANAVLNLPATQSWLNRLQPERTLYHWNSAWTWFPFRVRVTGFTINGQSWSQQWQMSAPAISGSLSLLPLFAETLHFDDVETGDIVVRFRPRPSPDRDDAAIRQYYPVIEGRDPNLPAEPVPTQTPGWRMTFDVRRINGQNDVWLAANRMTVVGEAAATITRQNHNGPLTISDGSADLTVKSLSVAGREVSDNASIKGTFAFATFVPQENRGLNLLPFLSLDADIDVPVSGLDFLDFFFTKVADMNLSGNGGLKGHVAYDRGALAPGTDVNLAADTLTVDLSPYSTHGSGNVAITVDAAAPDTLDANFQFKSVSVFRDAQHQTLFDGDNIAIAVARSAKIAPGANTEIVPRRVTMTIPSVTVPDVSVFQTYVPDDWNVEVLGGSGSLQGKAELSGQALDFDLTLSSDAAKVGFAGNSFETGLTLGILAKGQADGQAATIDAGGSYVDLDDSRLKTDQGDKSAPWHTHLAISKGEARFGLGGEADSATGLVGFWSLFAKQDLKSLLASVDGEAQAVLSVSDLGWVNFLFKNPFSLALEDSAEVDADLTVRSGRLVEGSHVAMPARDFTLNILDYIVEGSGGFDLVVAKGGANPDLRLDANLLDASLRLEDEKTAVVDQVTLAVTATAESVSLKQGGSVKQVELSIPSAKITDMAAYNTYLPEGSPVRILDGTADLSAKLVMDEATSTGFVKMKTSRISADVVGDRISGIIGLDVAIKGGSAKDKSFDISGSSLTVDGVRLSGEHATSGDWNGRVDIATGRVIWKRPMTLDVKAGFRLLDARPLLAIFDTSSKANNWLDRLLDLKNIRGNATISVAPKQVVVPYAFATSDTIDVGAKGIFRKGDRQGVFYARSGKLAGILAVDNDQKRFGLIDATGKFDTYVPGGPLPDMRGDPPAGRSKERNP